MFWQQWYHTAYPSDRGQAPSMDEAIFVCKLCGKCHLATHFKHDFAQMPTTITTARDHQGEFYLLCTSHEQAKVKEKGAKAPQSGSDGHDHGRHGEEANLQGQA